jgi:hypothetical protein
MAAIFLTITVDDLSSALELYDRIQVWRSTTGQNGTYNELTADFPEPAQATNTIASPWDLFNQSLNVNMSGADPVPIIFQQIMGGTIRIEEVIAQINAVIPGLATVSLDSNRLFTLRNPLTGTGSSLLFTGPAVGVLGLPTTKVSGKGSRISIGNANTVYRFKDLDGDSVFWYKWRFYSTKTKAVGSFSVPRLGDVSVLLPSENIAKASINLVDGSGRPISGRRVILVPVQPKSASNNNINYSVLPSNDRIIITTDEAGHAEIELLIGETFRVFFEGSGFAREFIVPNAEFDLLSVLSTQPDPFSIAQSPPMPIRES